MILGECHVPIFWVMFFYIPVGGYGSRSSETINYIGSTGFQSATFRKPKTCWLHICRLPLFESNIGPLQGTSPYPTKREWNIIFKMPFLRDMLVACRVDLQLRISWRNFLQVVFQVEKSIRFNVQEKDVVRQIEGDQKRGGCMHQGLPPRGLGKQATDAGNQVSPDFSY